LNLQSEHYNFSSVFSLAETTGIVPGTPHYGGTGEQGFNTSSYSLISDKIKNGGRNLRRRCLALNNQASSGSPTSIHRPVSLPRDGRPMG